MLTRVKRKISKQLSHENISEKAENPEAESPGRKQSTAERKQSTAERKQSRAERKRSTAEKNHGRSKSLESSESNPEVEYLMYEMQGLQAEVNSLRSQLEEEAKRSQELKSLKTQQVCALTFKLASAIRQREKAEENAAKAVAEMEKFQSQMTGINGVNVIASCEKSDEPDKLRKISEESNSSEKLDESEKDEACHVSDNEESKSSDPSALCRRKSGVVISPNELQRMTDGQEGKVLYNDSGYYSYNGEGASACRNMRDAETQTLVQEDKSVVDQGTQGNSVENFSSHQAYQELVSQEFSRIQEELGEVKGSMSMVHALNQRLSEDLQTFTKTYERFQGQKSDQSPVREKREQINEEQLSAPVSPRSDICFVRKGHHGSDEVDHGICEPQVEVKTCAEKLEIFEEKVDVQAAGVNYAENEWKKPSSENDCGSTTEKVSKPQEVNVSQEKEALGDSEMKTKEELRQAEGEQESDKARVNYAGLHPTEEKKSPEMATVHQMELLKEQLKIAMMEIDELRVDNNDMKRELRKISASAGNELLVKTTMFTDQLLREMKQRETSLSSQVNPVGKYPFALESDNCGNETEGVSLPKTVTPAQCPQLSAQSGMPRTVRGLEQSPRPSLPLRLLGNRLHEMTETLDNMTDRQQKQELVQKCVEDPLIPHLSGSASSSFVLKRRSQKPVLKGEPLLSSYTTERLGFEPILGSNERAFVTPMKLGERGIRSGSSAQLVERRKPGFLDEERSKPLDFSRAIRNSCSLRDARKPFSAQYTNDYVQRHIVRSSDYIAKLRDLRPEELDRPQED